MNKKLSLLALLLFSIPVFASNQGDLIFLALLIPLVLISIIAFILSLIFKQQGVIIMSIILAINLLAAAGADGLENVLLNASIIISIVGLLITIVLKQKMKDKEDKD